MNFEEEARQYALELDKIKSLGGRKNRIREILRWAYAVGRQSTVREAYIDIGNAPPPKPPPPMTFEIEEEK